MDILQPLPIKEWPLLQQLFKRDWPSYAQYYCRIDNAIKWNKKDPNYPRKIYCPNGKYNSGVYVEINSGALFEISIAALDDTQDLLTKALVETNLIDWNRPILFTAVDEKFTSALLEAVNQLRKLKNVHVTRANVTYYYFKSKEDCAKLNIEVPEECELRQLDRSHIPLIHSLWPHRSLDDPDSSTKFLESFVTFNRSVGLFIKKDNTLASWGLQNDWGGLGMLQTVEEYQRKGYGKVVVQAMIKQIAVEENLDSVVFIVDKNIVSQKLFTSLGYKRLTKATYYYIGKITK